MKDIMKLTVWYSDFDIMPNMTKNYARWLSVGILKIKRICKHFVEIEGEEFFLSELYN